MTLMLSWWYWKGVFLLLHWDLMGGLCEGLWEGLWLGEQLEHLPWNQLDLCLLSGLCLDLVSLLGDLPVPFGDLVSWEGH